jgi:hypothetical protein
MTVRRRPVRVDGGVTAEKRPAGTNAWEPPAWLPAASGARALAGRPVVRRCSLIVDRNGAYEAGIGVLDGGTWSWGSTKVSTTHQRVRAIALTATTC